jgi:hypothetical protein
LDIRADGGYVVGPGSVHESGTIYERLGSWPPIEQLPVFDPAWVPVGLEAPARRRVGLITDDRNHLLHRARAYVASVPPAIQGQGGDAHTFQLACKLVRGYDLDDADALELLRDWNQRCVPPWSETDLLDKIDGARKYGDEPIGGRIAAPTQTERTIAIQSKSSDEAVTALAQSGIAAGS